MKEEHKDKKNYAKNRRKTKEKKKMKKGKKIVLIVLLILILIGGGVFAYRTYKNGGGLSGMLATMVGHDENTKKNLKEIKVLILGISTDLDSQLTDTIMVASYDPNTQKANLLSIPRDTYTGKNTAKATAGLKINALYNINKTPEKTLEAVNELTGLDIKYYAVIKTEALIELVDAIGGVEFDVPIDMKYDDPTQDLHIDLKAGVQKLDGNKAEQLLRWRHSNSKNGIMTTYSSEYGNDDFGRMRTQRDFIAATLKQTLKPGNIFKIGELLEIANKNIDTNLEVGFLKDYIPYAVEFNTDDLKTAVLPGTTPDMKDTNNISIFVVNKKESDELIKSMFYVEENTDEEQNNTNNVVDNTTSTNNTTNKEIKIELLNGSGDKTKLEKAEEILKNAGFNVTKKGPTSTISKTIITNKKDATDEQLKQLKQTIGVGSISTSKSSTSLVDVTIVIGKDFEE